MYLLPQFSVMALMEKLFPIIGDTSCKKMKIFSIVSNISMILFKKNLS